MRTSSETEASGDRRGEVEQLTRRNVERIHALERREHEKATAADRIADRITNFSGSIRFVWITILLIGGWVGANLLLPARERIDPFPFPLLTLVLSIEAIFLSIFILMSQNRAARVSDKRSHLDLQLNLLSEQENTTMLLLLERIGRAVGAEVDDPDLSTLEQATKPEALSRQIDEAIEQGGPDAAPPGGTRRSPRSAGRRGESVWVSVPRGVAQQLQTRTAHLAVAGRAPPGRPSSTGVWQKNALW